MHRRDLLKCIASLPALPFLGGSSGVGSSSFSDWCRENIRIRHPLHVEPIVFDPYPVQARVASYLDRHPHCIVKKYRQGGFTTVFLAWALREIVSKSDLRVGFYALSEELRGHAESILRTAIGHLPGSFSCRSGEIINEGNGSRIYLVDPGERALRFDVAMVDEAAWVSSEDLPVLLDSISGAGRVVLSSTPHWRSDNWFRGVYEGDSLYTIIPVDYRDHPGYSDPLYLSCLRERYSESAFDLEILGEFPG